MDAAPTGGAGGLPWADPPIELQSMLTMKSLLMNGVQHVQPIRAEDAQIASIALIYAQPLVARKVKDFGNIDELTILNPWDGA